MICCKQMNGVMYSCSVSPFLLNCQSSRCKPVSLHSNQAGLAGPSAPNVNHLFPSGSTLRAGELEDIISLSRLGMSNISLEGLGNSLFLYPVLSQPTVPECCSPEPQAFPSHIPREFKEAPLGCEVSCFTQRRIE